MTPAACTPTTGATACPPAGLTVGDPRVRIAYTGPLKAPIAKGAQVAALVVTSPDGTTQRVPLAAGEAVEEAGFFKRLWHELLMWWNS